MRLYASAHFLLATSSASFILRGSQLATTVFGSKQLLSFGVTRGIMSSNTALNENVGSNVDSSLAAGIGLGDVSPRNERDYLPVNVPWREAIEVSMARSRKIRGSNFVQLATVSEDNEPRVRSVVFRGFAGKSGELETMMKIITDSRSMKIRDIQSQSKNMVELLWWFGKSSEQYRFRCSAKIIGDESNDEDLKKLRKEQWGNLSDKAREQFYWREPGVSYEKQFEVPEGGRDENGKVLTPPPTFLLLVLNPLQVDYLRLTDNYRQIDKFDSESNSWNLERVNP